MLCDNCQQEEASVFMKSETPQGTTERKLCKKCASDIGAFSPEFSIEPLLSVPHFLANWFGPIAKVAQEQPKKEVACPTCGLSFPQFIDRGKFGCATCYETFSEHLPPILTKLHGGHPEHRGKIPMHFSASYALESQIAELREEMQRAVVQEAFERAAALRDEIYTLEEQLQQALQLEDEKRNGRATDEGGERGE